MTFPIIMYHGVQNFSMQYRYLDPAELEWVLDMEKFNQQLEIICRCGFQSYTLAVLDSELEKGSCPRKPIIISFDDGHESNYHLAFPELAQRSLNAEFFITAGRIGKNYAMNQTQLKEMAAAGMSIQSHGMSHRFLTGLDDQDLKEELSASKHILEDITGQEVFSLAYPGGRYDDRTEGVAKAIGYRATYTAVRGYNELKGKRFGLRRQGVSIYTTEKEFIAQAENDHWFYLQRLLKKNIGNIYRKLVRAR